MATYSLVLQEECLDSAETASQKDMVRPLDACADHRNFFREGPTRVREDISTLCVGVVRVVGVSTFVGVVHVVDDGRR